VTSLSTDLVNSITPQSNFIDKSDVSSVIPELMDAVQKTFTSEQAGFEAVEVVLPRH
jgi:hypothetical protein